MRMERIQFRRHTILSAIWMLVLLCGGCSWFKHSSGGSDTSVIPLTPTLWFSPSLTTAALPYKNACGEPASFSIAAPLVDTVPTKLGRVFTDVKTQPSVGEATGSDGVIEVGVGLKKIDLVVPDQVKGTYPVTVTLSVEAVFLAQDGTLLFRKKLQSVGQGEVEALDQSCDVIGLEPVVVEVIELVTEDLAGQVLASVRIREYAAERSLVPPVATDTSAPTGTEPLPALIPTTPLAGAAAGGVPANAGTGQGQAQLQSKAASQEAALSFHAIVRDESRDQILQPDESLTIEVEVKNDGPSEAKGVEVVVEGLNAVTAQFPQVVVMGNVLPGEVKRTSITDRVTELKEERHGELVLNLRSATPLASRPPAKKFTLLIKPEKGYTVPTVPDVDHLPNPLAESMQSKAVVIAIGIERFRSEHVPAVKHASRDAEVMASYLRAISGVPDDRVRVLLDNFALKADLAEIFEEWLPKRVDATTVVYVFFAGRALVEGKSGSVFLVPFDGTTSSMNRLYPIQRMQETLSLLPIQRAIMMFEVSLDPSPGADPAAIPPADWEEGVDDEKDQVMWMVGNRGLQDAHAYEQGGHGLFTYYLLRGLQGLADSDRDGTVVAGELCTYARSEVIQTARKQFGNAQQPICSPPPGHGAVVRIQPMAKGNNPEPAPVAQQEDPPLEASPQALEPMEVGPRP